MKLISYFFITFIITLLTTIVFAKEYLQSYNEKIIVNYTLDSYYTGQIDNKLFLTNNLFSQNPYVLIPTFDILSEGVYIQRFNSDYILFSNINSFNEKSYLLATYFYDSDNKIKIIKNIAFKMNDNYNALDFVNINSNKLLFIIGLIHNIFDIDISISYFDGNIMSKGLLIGTNFSDYPIFFNEYKDSSFDGYLIISLCDRGIYRNIYDFRTEAQIRRFISDTILVCFLDRELNVKKYFTLRFPKDIVDYSIVRKSIDSVLLRVDFIDRISGYLITQNFINISFSNTKLLDNVGSNIFNRFYIENLFNFKSKFFDFYQSNKNIVFTKKDLVVRYK